MPKYLLHLIPLLAFCLASLALRNADRSAGSLSIRFENIEKKGGTIRLALYGKEEDFMKEAKASLYNFGVPQAGVVNASIADLPSGTYAFAVFLDENNNKKLDKNLFGVPVEPYGFSKQPSSKWRLPSFDEVKFDLNGLSRPLAVPLRRWAL